MCIFFVIITLFPESFIYFTKQLRNITRKQLQAKRSHFLITIIMCQTTTSFIWSQTRVAPVIHITYEYILILQGLPEFDPSKKLTHKKIELNLEEIVS